MYYGGSVMKYYDKNGKIYNSYLASILFGLFSKRNAKSADDDIVIDETDIVIPQGKNKIVIDDDTNQVVLMSENNDIIKKSKFTPELIQAINNMKEKSEDIEKNFPSSEEVRDMLFNNKIRGSINDLNRGKLKIFPNDSLILERIKSLFRLK